MDILAFSELGLWGQWILPILLLVFGVGMVVFVHELGHFIVAKAVGIKVERFALGFGKRLFGFQRGGTDYCINLIPLGGYIKMLGQEDFAPLKDSQPDPAAFNNKSVGQRFAVIAAGVIMNVIFAAVLFILICLVGIRFEAPVVGAVVPGAPADTVKIHWDGPVPVTEIQWPAAELPGPVPASQASRPATASAPAALPATMPALAAPRVAMVRDTTGFEPGDTFATIDGREITRFSQVKMTALLGDRDREYRFVVRRQVDGVTRTGEAVLGLKTAKSPSGSGSDVLEFGVAAARGMTFGIIHDMDIDSPFKEGDRIVAVNKTPVEYSWQMDRVADTLAGRPADVTVERGVRREVVRVQPTLMMSDTWCALKDGTVLRGKQAPDGSKDNERFFRVLKVGGGQRRVSEKEVEKVTLDVLGMRPRLVAASLFDGSPAQKAGLKPGDVIAVYADQGPLDRQKLADLTEENVGKKTSIVVERKGKRLDTMWITPVRKGGEAINGFLPGVDMEHLVVAAVRKGSPAQLAGLQSGDEILAVDGAPVSGWAGLVGALQERPGKPVTITYARGTARNTWTIAQLSPDQFFPKDYRTDLLLGQRPLLELKGSLVKHGPLGAIGWGVRETWMFTLSQYATLRSLFKGNVSPKEGTGPLGIGKIAIDIGRKGVVDFLYFLAMISVALAVVNFLPIPVVDGGHAVFLIIEKVRGKPLSVHVMNVVQAIGLALLLFVFVYVTWNDILRIFFH